MFLTKIYIYFAESRKIFTENLDFVKKKDTATILYVMTSNQ